MSKNKLVTEETVKAVEQLVIGGLSTTQIANVLKFSTRTIGRIKSSGYSFSNYKEKLKEIENRHKNKEVSSEIEDVEVETQIISELKKLNNYQKRTIELLELINIKLNKKRFF